MSELRPRAAHGLDRGALAGAAQADAGLAAAAAVRVATVDTARRQMHPRPIGAVEAARVDIIDAARLCGRPGARGCDA